MKEVFIKTMLGWKTIVQFEDGAIARPEDHPLEVVDNEKVQLEKMINLYLQDANTQWPQESTARSAEGGIDGREP